MTDMLSYDAPSFSPLEPIFAFERESVPPAFRAQFLHSPDDPFRVVLEGRLHEIWHKPRWLKPLFWALGQAGILVPKSGHNIPSTLEVIPARHPNGEPYHRWNRTLQFTPPVHFNTTIVYDPETRYVADLVGPHDFLYLVWKAKFWPPSTFTLDTEACAAQIGRQKLWLPRWLWPLLLGVVRFVQKADLDTEDTVHIELIISHPLFGDFFGYTGTFHVVRYPLN